jgi:DNA-binding SARP family transcriptional activator
MIYMFIKKLILSKLFFPCLLLLGLLLNYQASFTQNYGLNFNGNEVTLGERTELNLCPDGFLKFQDEVEISFDYMKTRISSYDYQSFFGYVFRIITEDENNIDLLSTPTPDIGLNLVVGKTNTIIPIDYPSNAINNWINLKINLNLKEDKLIFSTPDTFYVQNTIGFKQTESLKIIFGANDYKQFKNTDVPSMTIRNLKIVENGKLKYHWPLDEEEGDIATDKIKGKEAIVLNPSWFVINNQNWQKVYDDDKIHTFAVAADEKNGKIFILRLDELTIYSTESNSIVNIEYLGKPAYLSKSYRAIYNEIDSCIYCYLVDKAPYYKLNINTGEWNEIGSLSRVRSRFLHHNSYFDPSSNQLYLFGGYGLHRYESAIRRINFTNQIWEDLPANDSIFPPRYLAGLGSLNDTLYILGGYGSESGNQLINPKNYYDLIGYSVKDNNLFRKFEIPKIMEDMIVGNSMWINEKYRNYYALVYSKLKYENELVLIKGNLDSAQVEFVGDRIPFKFLDISSFASMFYMPGQEKLFAYTLFSSDSVQQVSIYSIDAPPVPDTNLNKSKGTKSNYYYILAAILLILGIGYWFFIYKKKIRRNYSVYRDVLPPDQFTELNGNIENKQDIKYNLIFFGGFQVFDKEYIDITNKFSPLLKELFLLIMLNTYKNNKGISSDKITEALWMDKSEKSAKNNRAVNIAKLRTILDEIGSCEVSKKTGYWKFECEKSEIKSDYIHFLNITSSKTNLNKQKVIQLMLITKKGAFLHNVHYEWLDEFKSTVSDTIVDTLVLFGQECDIKKDADFIIQLADCIFNFDYINEDAMILKCKAQYCKGKHSHAQTSYDKFCKEYLNMYGQEYERGFLDILEINE